MVGELSRIRLVLLILFLVIVWGINFALSKYALSYMPPMLFSGTRTLLGGLLLMAVAIPRYKKLNIRSSWWVYLISAMVNVVMYYSMQTIGLVYMPSGLFSSIVFLQPVLVGIFSWMWLGESMNVLKMLGFILGFAGVGIISSGAGGLDGHISMTGILLALGTAFSWAFGTIFVKKTRSLADPIWLVALQFLIGGMIMTGWGSGIESWSDVVWAPSFILTLLFISIFVIAFGWLAFYRLIDSGEAGKVSTYTFLIPIVAILTGTFIFHEPFMMSLLAGFVLVVASIYLVNRRIA